MTLIITPRPGLASNHRTITITIANTKGGTAKTTTALNLATELSKLGYSVLLIDLDPQGSLSKAMLGEHELSNYRGIEELLVTGAIHRASDSSMASIAEYITPTKIAHVAIIPCHAELGEVAVKLLMNAAFFALKDVIRNITNDISPNSQSATSDSERISRNSKLATSNSKLLSHNPEPEFIIIDTQPAKNILMLNAFAASDYVLIPTNPSVYPLMDIVELEATIKATMANSNPNLAILGVLITMVQRATVYKQLEHDLREYFEDKVFATTISRAAKSEESAVEGVGVSALDPKCKLSQEYRALALEILERLELAPHYAAKTCCVKNGGEAVDEHE